MHAQFLRVLFVAITIQDDGETELSVLTLHLSRLVLERQSEKAKQVWIGKCGHVRKQIVFKS